MPRSARESKVLRRRSTESVIPTAWTPTNVGHMQFDSMLQGEFGAVQDSNRCLLFRAALRRQVRGWFSILPWEATTPKCTNGNFGNNQGSVRGTKVDGRRTLKQAASASKPSTCRTAAEPYHKLGLIGIDLHPLHNAKTALITRTTNPSSARLSTSKETCESSSNKVMSRVAHSAVVRSASSEYSQQVCSVKQRTQHAALTNEPPFAWERRPYENRARLGKWFD